MRTVVRLKYYNLPCACSLKGVYSEDFLINGDKSIVIIHGSDVTIQSMKITKNDVDVKILYKHKAKTMRAAKVAARRWLIKNKASVKMEARKSL